MVMQAKSQPRDVIVVLGLGLLPDGSASRMLKRRVARGVELLQRGAAPMLLMSGGPREDYPSEASVMRELALAAGVPDAQIALEPWAGTTLENARFSARIMRQRGWSRALVVSEPMHVLRALLVFRRLGINARGAPVEGFWSLRPRRTVLKHVLYETMAITWYGAHLLLTPRAQLD
jgi:uncharacterized SAM-binding protein YcdF (DUF218 family)